jgi:hypothetical protein
VISVTDPYSRIFGFLNRKDKLEYCLKMRRSVLYKYHPSLKQDDKIAVCRIYTITTIGSLATLPVVKHIVV